MIRACLTSYTTDYKRSNERSELNFHEQNQHARSIRPLKNNFVRIEHFILLLAGIVFFDAYLPTQVSASVSQREAVPNPNFHIYISFGQSNMEGPGPILKEDTTGVDPRIKVITVAPGDYQHLGRIVATGIRQISPCDLGAADFPPMITLDGHCPIVFLTV